MAFGPWRHKNTAESMSVVPCFMETIVKKKVGKGGWRMPRLIQAMKDVISCDKPWVGANDP